MMERNGKLEEKSYKCFRLLGNIKEANLNSDVGRALGGETNRQTRVLCGTDTFSLSLATSISRPRFVPL